jgi:hypothetical protein
MHLRSLWHTLSRWLAGAQDWRHWLAYFIEMDVAGLGADNVAPHQYLIRNPDGLPLAGRIVGQGPTNWSDGFGGNTGC